MFAGPSTWLMPWLSKVLGEEIVKLPRLEDDYRLVCKSPVLTRANAKTNSLTQDRAVNGRV